MLGQIGWNRARRVQELSDSDQLINLFLDPDSSRTSNTVNEIFQSESDDPSEETTVDFF